MTLLIAHGGQCLFSGAHAAGVALAILQGADH